MKQQRRHILSLLLATIVVCTLFACLYACRQSSHRADGQERQASRNDTTTSIVNNRPSYSPDAPLGIRYTQNHPLRVVGDWNRAPLSYVNSNGQPAGIHVEIMRRILDKFHISYNVTLMDNGKALEAVQSGEAHLVMEFPNAPLRNGVYMGSVDLSEYFEVALRLNDTPQLRSILLLTDEDTVGIKPNSYADRFLGTTFEGDIPFNVEYMTIYEGLEGVVSGRVKYFLSGEPQLRNYIKKYGVEESVSLDIIDMPQVHFRFVSNDSVLLHEVENVYKQMRVTGELEDMQKFWLEGKSAKQQPFHLSEMGRTLALVSLLILIVFVIFVVKYMARSNSLKKEFLDITYLATDMINSQLLYYNLGNKTIRNILGTFLPSQGITVADFYQLIHPDDQLRLKEVMALIQQGIFPDKKVTLRMHTPSDKAAWCLMQVKGRFVDNYSGQHIGMYISLIDITDETQKAKQIGRELGNYSNLMDLQFMSMAHYDNEGHLVNCNLTYKQFFGSRRREEAELYLRKTNLRQLCDNVFNVERPADNDQWVCSHLQIPELALDVWGEVRIRAVKDTKGRSQGYMVIARDLTEPRRVVRQQLDNERNISSENQLNQRYNTELKAMLWRNKIYIVRWNAGNDFLEFYSSTTGAARTLSLHHYTDLLIGEEMETIHQMLEHPETHFAKPGRYRHHLNRNKMVGMFGSSDLSSEKGDVIIFDEAWCPDYTEDGTLLGAYGVIIEITSLVAKEEQLKKQRQIAETVNTDRSNFLANMTHELHTPLNAVNGFAEMLMLPNTPEERKEYISIMSHNNRLMLSVVDNILQLSTFDLEGISVKRKETDFAQAFHNAVQSLSGYVTGGNVSFRYDLPHRELFLNVDARRILQVLDIFVNNASKYTEKGYIRVGYRYDDTQLTVYCTDTGCGIPLEQQQHLFEMFYKVNEFMPGIGLGLTLASSIANAMDATINCYSRVGQGTTMSIDVPYDNRNKDAIMQQNAAMTAAIRS